MLYYPGNPIESERLDGLYHQIATDFQGKPLLIVAVVGDGFASRAVNRGNELFPRDLIPHDGVVPANGLIRSESISAPFRYLRAQYSRDRQSIALQIDSTGLVALPASGRHVLLIDGLMATGRKLWTIRDQISQLRPLSVETFVMVEMYGLRAYTIQPDYVFRRFPNWEMN